MCGIYGFICKENTSSIVDRDLADFFEQGMLIGTLRGRDGFGVFTARDNAKCVETLRYPVSAATLFETPIRGAIRDTALKSVVAIGHHRAATVGGVKQSATHPHTGVSKERIVTGVHNGSLTGYNLTSHSSDSEWLYQRIADEGYKVLDTINGSFALVWMQSDDPDAVFIAKNNERPLWFATLKDDAGYLIASEHSMISWLVDRINILIKQEGKYSYFGFNDNEVTRIDLKTMERSCVHKITKVTVSYPKSYVPFESENESYYGTTYDGHHYELMQYNSYIPSHTTHKEIEAAYDMDRLGEYCSFKLLKLRPEKEGKFRATFSEIDDDGQDVGGELALCRDVGPEYASMLAEGNMIVRAKIIGLSVSKDPKDCRTIIAPPVGVWSADLNVTEELKLLVGE